MDNGRPYSTIDFESIQPIDPSMSVGALIDRLRHEFGLAELNEFVKAGVQENMTWLPPYNMPIDSIENPAEAMQTRVVLNVPADLGVALELLLRGVILPSLNATEQWSKTKRQTATV